MRCFPYLGGRATSTPRHCHANVHRNAIAFHSWIHSASVRGGIQFAHRVGSIVCWLRIVQGVGVLSTRVVFPAYILANVF